MRLFRKCDETVIVPAEPTDEMLAVLRNAILASEVESIDIDPAVVYRDMLAAAPSGTIKCNACGRVRIDQRSV